VFFLLNSAIALNGPLPLALITLVVGFPWNTSSPLLVAAPVSTVELALLLGKGIEEMCVEFQFVLLQSS